MNSSMKESATAADRLVIVEAISALKARYLRLMDTKSWDEWQQVFAPDAVMDMTGEGPAMRSIGFNIPADFPLIWKSAAEIRAAVSGSLATFTTVHHGHMPEIVVLSPNEARGVWAMEDMIIYGSAAPVPGFRGYGHYFETYVNLDGQWHIKTIQLKRLHVEAITKL